MHRPVWPKLVLARLGFGQTSSGQTSFLRVAKLQTSFGKVGHSLGVGVLGVEGFGGVGGPGTKKKRKRDKIGNVVGTK